MVELHPKDILRHIDSGTIVSYFDIADAGLTTDQIEYEFEVIHYAWREGKNLPNGLLRVSGGINSIRQVSIPSNDLDLRTVEKFQPIVENPFPYNPDVEFDWAPSYEELHWSETLSMVYTDSRSIDLKEKAVKLERSEFHMPISDGADVEVGHKLTDPTDVFDVIAASATQLVLESPNRFEVVEKVVLGQREFEVGISGFRVKIEHGGIDIDESHLSTLRALNYKYLTVAADERVWAYTSEPVSDHTGYVWEDQEDMLEVTNIVNDIDVESWYKSKQEF